MFRYGYGRPGRINRAVYWFGLALFVAVFIALRVLTAEPPQEAEVVVMIFAIPRLHDVGKSGWWVGGVFLTEIVMVVIAIVTLPMDAAKTVFGVFALVVIGLLIWLGAVAGDPNANRYGEPPTRGISMYPWQKKSV